MKGLANGHPQTLWARIFAKIKGGQFETRGIKWLAIGNMWK